MARLLITDPMPLPPAEIAEGTLVIAPDAAPFRAMAVEQKSLYQVAKDSLKKKGFGIASPMRSAEALRSAVIRALPGADAGSVSRHYRETVAAILRSGIDVTKLMSVGSERARTAATIAAEYVAILKRSRLIDRDAVFTEAVRNDAVKRQRVLVYGYFRARQLPARSEELEFIDTVADDGSIFYLPCGEEPIFASNRDWLKVLKDLGWQAESRSAKAINQTEINRLATRFSSGDIAENRRTGSRFEALEFANLENEVRGTLAVAKASVLSGVSIDRVVIACRDIKAYVWALMSAGREYGLPLDIDLKVPLAKTAFGELISLFLETIDRSSENDSEAVDSGFEYEPTLRLLTHRLGAGLSDEARILAYQSLPSGLDQWKQITDEVEFLYTSGRRNFSEWILWMSSLLARWEIRSAKKLGSDASEILAYDLFFRSLDQLATERGNEPIEISKFAADVTDVLLNVSTPIHAEKGGVKVRQPNEIIGSDFDEMFVIGMAEGVLPSPAADSNVIDFFEREELRSHGIHFQNALEVPRWEALTFYFMLLACRGKATFSFPLFSGDSEQLQSSYFKRMGLKPQKPKFQFVSSVQEWRQAFLLDPNSSADEVFNAARHQFFVEERRESGEPPDEYDGVIGTPIVRNSWSASSLAKIGSCPFKWFASDLLRLRTAEEADTDLPANTRGTLLHKALEIAVRRSLNAHDLRSAVSEALEAAFAEAELLDKSLTLVTNWHLRRVEQIEKLRIAAASEYFVQDGASVVEVEKPFEAELCGLTIKGTIDRIDRLSDGTMLALDYKHGSYLAKVKDEDGFLNVEIQLPLYSMVALPKLYPESVTGGRFFHLSDPKNTEVKSIDLVGFVSRIKTILDTGNFAVEPDHLGKACEYCEFDVVCRVGQRLERRSGGN